MTTLKLLALRNLQSHLQNAAALFLKKMASRNVLARARRIVPARISDPLKAETILRIQEPETKNALNLVGKRSPTLLPKVPPTPRPKNLLLDVLGPSPSPSSEERKSPLQKGDLTDRLFGIRKDSYAIPIRCYR
ncbi:MAG TPA: hypothetical protein DCL41_06565 [Bdellovibrionales bacterium]|nr:hypothetical protein [Bdellovibrionales bacterium]